MNNPFWIRMHGGATHFPIALMLVSVLFDGLSLFIRDEIRCRNLRAAGFYSLLVGAVVSFGAVASGLALSKGILFGNGLIARHHKFVWPAFGLLIGLAVWRLVVRDSARPNAFRLYLAAAITTALLMGAAGYWGGEILLALS